MAWLVVGVGVGAWLLWTFHAYKQARAPRGEEPIAEVGRSLFIAVPIAAVVAGIGIDRLVVAPFIAHLYATPGKPNTAPQPPHVLEGLLPSFVPLPVAIAGTALLVVFLVVLAIRLRAPADSGPDHVE